VRALAEQLLVQAVAHIDADQLGLALAERPPALTQQHELIRDPAEYAEFFARNSQSSSPEPPTPEIAP
jgi:hypothetical protein